MIDPGLQKTTAVSAVLHLGIFLVTFIILRYTAQNALPSPYMVTLVSPGSGRASESSSETERAAESRTEPAVHEPTGIIAQKEKAEAKRLEDRIAELKAKKKLEQIVKLRSVIAVGGKAGRQTGSRTQGSPGGTPGGGGTDSYIAKITDEIHQQWGWPSAGGKDLEAVIAVRIQKDGSIIIKDFEKRSGNRLFDNFALNALRKASPVAPPPSEMEIGIRFYP